MYSTQFGCQSVSVDIVLAHGMPDLEVFELAQQRLRFLIEFPQIRIFHLVDTLHLPHHELRITHNFDRLDPVLDRVAKHGQQSLILGIVVGVVPKIFAEFRYLLAGRVLNNHSIARRTRVAASSSIDVSGIGGGTFVGR